MWLEKIYKNCKAGQSPAEASWSEARVFDGGLAEGIRELKAEPGKPIVAIGGAGFMQSLIATGLIDEYTLATHPVALGLGAANLHGSFSAPNIVRLCKSSLLL